MKTNFNAIVAYLSAARQADKLLMIYYFILDSVIEFTLFNILLLYVSGEVI